MILQQDYDSPSGGDLLKTLEEAMKILKDQPPQSHRTYEFISVAEGERRQKLINAAVSKGKSEIEIYYASKGFTPEQTPDRHKKRK